MNTIRILIVFILLSISCKTTHKREGDIEHIVTHSQQTIVCGKGGNAYYRQWGIFPSSKEKIRRIKMNITLGHPDSIAIAHWDYLDHISIKRSGGKNKKNIDLEIGRMLTPYGSNFQKGWEWKWTVDVTDFSNLLRDSVEIEYTHSGYESTSVGWDLTVDFEFVYGTPITEWVGYKDLYKGNYSYGNVEEPIENTLTPVTVDINTETDFCRIRVQHTGHGMDKPKGCSEFCSRWREILVDDTVIDRRDMWKECSNNSLYPQGGTWIFDRAYWCPGDLQKPDLIDFSVSQKQHTIDFRIEPYTADGKSSANENISATLFEYKYPNAKYDVSIEEILVPNNKKSLNRFNPASFNPTISIQNVGSEPLTSLNISYGTVGYDPKNYTWTGHLKFHETTIIVLPGEIDFHNSKHKFKVEIKKPNNEIDLWKFDNSKTVEFDDPKKLPKRFILKYKSNKKPKDNTIKIINNNGEVVYLRDSLQSKPNSIYYDTLDLKEGNYEMVLTDKSEDGLEFWFLPKNGYGYLQIFDLNNNILHAFESDCGQGEKLAFKISKEFEITNIKPQNIFLLYPRMIDTVTELNVALSKKSDLVVHILSDTGNIIKEYNYKDVKNKVLTYNFTNLDYGRYVIQAFIENKSVFKNRVGKYPPGKFK